MRVFSWVFFALVFGCGGLGVEQYREARPHATLALHRLVACDAASVRLPNGISGAEECLSPPLTSRGDITRVQRLSSDSEHAVLVLLLSDRGRARLSAVPTDSTLAVVARGRVQATPHVHNVLDAPELYLRMSLARIDAQYLALTE